MAFGKRRHGVMSRASITAVQAGESRASETLADSGDVAGDAARDHLRRGVARVGRTGGTAAPGRDGARPADSLWRLQAFVIGVCAADERRMSIDEALLRESPASARGRRRFAPSPGTPTFVGEAR